MGNVEKSFSLDRFKEAVQSGLFLPASLTYDYVDEALFEQFQTRREWKESKMAEIFDELRRRMGYRYFRNVMLAQTFALDYAALQFPVYSMLIAEDLSDDWLAIVDFHKKHCRDHSLHQPLTAYIAASLLGFGKAEESLSISIDPGNLLDYCVSTILTSDNTGYLRETATHFGFPLPMIKDTMAAREFWKGLFYRTVVLSTLFHDIGYPWQYIDGIGKGLRNNVQILHPIDTTASTIIERFKNRLVMLPLRHYITGHLFEPINEGEELYKLITMAMGTHGFPGAIAFLTLNDSIRKFPPDKPMAMIHEFMVEWAAMGILMHDMVKIHKKGYPKLRVNIQQDPLSAIVSIADYLEEFNRPKVFFKPKSRQSQMKYYSDCLSVEVHLESKGVLVVKMNFRDKTSKAIATAIKTEETDDYFDEADGYLDLSPIGIKKVLFEPE